MKHLIVGAGATLAEALALGNSREQCPPLMNDFARKMWADYTPYPLLEEYLRHLGHTKIGNDPRDLFYRLEREGDTNIEAFMEYAWNNRHRNCAIEDGPFPPGYISGLQVSAPGAKDVSALDIHGKFWGNMLYHGIGRPISEHMGQCFFENGKGWKTLEQSQSLISHLSP